jgi:hypothetical protein
MRKTAPLVALLGAVVALAPVTSLAKKRSQSLAVSSPDAANWPASKYASLSASDAMAELSKREIPFEPVADGARGVVAPVRLKGPVHAVSWHTELPLKDRATAPWEIFDARLVLAMDDFGAVLQKHGIDDVVIFSSWRPPPKSWPDAKPADRHPGAMAVDAKRFHKKDGDASLVVEKDFHGHIGATTCGEHAAIPEPKTAGASELRAIVCEAASDHTFHSILTPNFNRAHFNHFHLEVKAGVSWQLVR